MLFNSLKFAAFFFALIALYPIIPRKARVLYLLVASLIFYMSWNVKYVLLMIVSILITYVCGLLLESEIVTKQGTKKIIIAIGFMINLLILALFKYYNFFIENINKIFEILTVPVFVERFDVLLPVGISFYTFQALGYIIDVYRKEVKVEKNLIRYALFVSFFPQLVAGPIERSKNLLCQVQVLPDRKVFVYNDMVSGFILMLWGYFMKMVVADRAALLVNNVYTEYMQFGFFGLSIATFCFAVQIYCDFASYSMIATGAAKIFGFKLMENFNTPYFAYSVSDFWRRWHISLSTWFRDYLYIPLGGNRVSAFRNNINTIIVFVVSGLWHGASLHFVVWGSIWAFFMVISNITKPIRKKAVQIIGIKTDCFSYGLWQCLSTFSLTCFAWIFFRAISVKHALGIIKRMFAERDIWSFFDGAIYRLGLERQEINILFFSITVVFLVDLIRYKKNMTVDVFILKQNIIFQWVLTIAMVIYILIFGVYGFGFDPQQFIYFQF